MKNRSLSWVLSLGVLLAACGGGGLLALLPYVAAIGGNWVSADNEFLVFNSGQNDLFATSTATYPATLNSQSAACGAAGTDLSLVAKFDGQNFTLSQSNAAASCLSGTFVDDMTLVLATGGSGTRYQNLLTLLPQFEQGVWTNIDRPAQRLKFRDDNTGNAGVNTQTGCEFDGTTQTGSVVMTWRQSNGVPPTIDSIVITRAAGTETWTQGSMYGLSGVKIGAGSSTVSLERRNEALGC